MILYICVVVTLNFILLGLVGLWMKLVGDCMKEIVRILGGPKDE